MSWTCQKFISERRILELIKNKDVPEQLYSVSETWKFLSLNISRTVLVNPMNKFSTVHGAVNSWTPNQAHYGNNTRTDTQELIWYTCSWTYHEQRCSWTILISSWKVEMLVSFTSLGTVLVNLMNELRTVHGTVIEHQIKNIVGNTWTIFQS
jgi:hypothetical protein